LLIDALKNNNIYIQKGAAFSLGKINPSSKIAIESLLKVVQDESNNLEIRRVAAEALVKLGIDTQLFFYQNNLINPQYIVCPSIRYTQIPATFTYDSYSGRCLVVKYGSCPTCLDFSTLYDAIKNIFQGK